MKNRRPVIGVDLDETVGDTSEVMAQIMQEKFGFTFSKEDLKQGRYHHHLPITEGQEFEAFDLFHESRCANVKIFDGAKDGLIRLSEIGEVWFITARPESCRDITSLWAKFEELSHTELHHEYDKTIFKGRIDVMVEDSESNAYKMAEVGIPVILIDRPWNRYLDDHALIKRVYNWKQIVQEVENRFLK
jgi:uncharacterized HAD superfamily protein